VPKIDLLALEPGDMLGMRTPGGGGNGDPLERPVEAVAADVEAGLVTPAHARAAYGVVLAAGAVDPAATRALRAEGRGAAGPPGRSTSARPATPTSGAGRPSSAPYRAYVRRALYARITARTDRDR